MFLPGMFGNGSGPISLSPTQWISSMTGRKSAAGVTVTPESALGYSAVQACVTLLAESVAQLPCHLYRRTGDDTRERATDHPVYGLVNHTPNKKDTAFEYFEQGQGCLGLRGNTFSLIDHDGAGYPSQLWPVNPTKVQVLKGADSMPYYKVPELGETFPARMMHHVKSFSLNGYTGVSPIQTNPDTIGSALAVDAHGAQVFANGTTLSGVIERPAANNGVALEPLKQAAIDRILSKFIERHSGLENFFSVAMLQEGMQFKQLAMNNEDAQLLQSRKYGAIEVCRLYKIPPHMIAELERSTNNNIEHQGLQFVIYTLMPWLKRWESAMNRDLLLPSERSEYYIEFNVSALLRGDLQSRYTAYAQARQWGWLSVNDIRRLENMPPIPGGDLYLTPMNMQPASEGRTAEQLAITQALHNTAVTTAQIDEIKRALKQ